jgi:UDP-GlcNAc:undecaprenyl-phosphate GlcNAc-1-phosphate transferase
MITHARTHARARNAGSPDRRPRLVAAALVAVAGLVAWRFSVPAALWCVAAAATTWAMVPWVSRFAVRRGATVLPGGRSIHTEPTPLLGGLAIFVPFAAFLFTTGRTQDAGLAVGCAVMALAGACDDIRGLSPRLKILAQVLAALALACTGYTVQALSIPPFGALPTAGVEILVVVFWVVLVTNAVNLIDGMDGLASMLVLVAAASCALLGFAPLPAIVLAGACLGFLRHNLPRARIFLGDAGSLVLGFAASALLLRGGDVAPLPVMLGVVAVPLGDVALTAARRWVRGKPIFSGDRRHLHHRLLDMWGTPARVVFGLTLFAAAQAAVVARMPDLRGLGAVAGLWAAAILFLVVRSRPRWTRILLHRKTFRKLWSRWGSWRRNRWEP